ncbi:MAG: hypothetical protein H0Z29_04540 [Candidatus Marinimicrobia bacterium]|nr:hypothetical protein [Candidatus Neomarinimicrobiota bacterium]
MVLLEGKIVRIDLKEQNGVIFKISGRFLASCRTVNKAWVILEKNMGF